MEEIDRKILETAAEMFMKKGPAVAMRAIVEATGLSSKTVYARFSSKEALLPAAIRHILKAAPGHELTLPASGDVRGALRDFFLRATKNAYEPETMALRRLLSADVEFARQLKPDIAQVIRHSYTQPIEAFLASAREAGLIRAMDLQRVARAITMLILAEPTSRISDGLPQPSPAELEEWADFLADFILSGVRSG